MSPDSDLPAFTQAVLHTLGTDALRQGPAGAAYERDAMRGSGSAGCVLLPASRDDAATVLRLAHAHRVPVVCQGARSGLVGAALPDRSGTQCVLSSERLTRVIGFDRANRSISVESGLRLSALQALLAPHDLHLPIDIGSDPSVGGLVATNAGGSRLLRHGDVRRQVLGLEVMLADGDATRLDRLAPIRKSNVGIDVKQLFVGAGGALGFVSAVSFELSRRDRSSATFFVALPDLAAATRTLEAFEAAFGELLAAFEFIDARSLAAVLRRFPALRAPLPTGCGRCHALVEAASAMPGLDETMRDRGVEVLTHLCRDGHVTDAALDAAADFWRLRHALPVSLAGCGLPLAFDIGFARSDLPLFMAAAQAWLADAHPALDLHAFGHFGDGGIHLVVLVPRPVIAAYPAPRREALQADLHDLAHRHRGSFSAEHGVGPANFGRYLALTPAPLQRIDARLQALFDPAGLLGRCRYG